MHDIQGGVEGGASGNGGADRLDDEGGESRQEGGMGSEARNEHMLQLWRIDQQWKLQQEVSWRF